MNRLKNLLAFFIGLLVAVVILEVGLRIYNPFPVRMKNGTLFLPVNRTFTFHNQHIPGLDTMITVQNNHLGFRGPDLPADLANHLSIIAVGGSTTECRFISEGEDWVSLLSNDLNNKLDQPVWINNAGLAGNSTFGHRILMQQHVSKIQPDYALFLVGINEILRADDFNDDLAIQSNRTFSKQDWLKKNSEIALIINNIRRSIKAYTIESGHGRKALELESRKHHTIDYKEISNTLRNHKTFTSSYQERLKLLLQETKEYEIKPIVMTQPLLYGTSLDEHTGVDLATISSRFEYGTRYWQIMEEYNEVTRQVCQELNIPLIDLACLMPKNSSYFYDSMHFTKKGAVKVSELVEKELMLILSEQYVLVK